MRTIAVVNQKGGCGKTTVSINLAHTLAESGKKVLLVDMDPQSHCAVGLAVPEEQTEQSIYDVLISRSRNEPIKLTEILWQISDNLELAPASIDLSAFEQQMSGIPDRECCLRDALDEISGDYEYVVIDCPPAVGLLTFNALRAATDVVVPVETGYFSLHGLSKQLETLKILCERCNQQVNVRVLGSMYDIRTKMAREILAELRSHFADKMFKTVVNFNTKIKEASSFGQPVGEYDPASKGHQDFRNLAEEVIEAETRQQQRQIVNSLADQLEAISSSADELLAETRAEPVLAEPELVVEEVSVEQTATVEAAQVALEPQPVEMAAEPVATDAVEVATEPEPVAQATMPGSELERKLANYYGVNQISDAIVFVTLYPRAQTVQVAGDFNNWEPANTPMHKVGQTGVWQTKIKLPAGKYRYRLVVDGHWQQDPYNETTELNPFGGYNSVLEVK